jgi:hypothetical protein
MQQRDITEQDVQEVVADPDETCEQEDGCVRYYKYLAKFKRVIRVVCNGTSVVTAMPDRTYKRRTK